MIKNLKKMVCIVMLVLASIVYTDAATNSILGIINPQKIVFSYENEIRLRDKGSSFYYDHNDFQVKYLLSKYSDIFTDYRLILQNKSAGFKDQSMFLEGFNLKYPESTNWGKINLRSRLEIGLNQSPAATTYQLNEFPKYNTPWKFTRFDINPFVADESFYDVVHGMAFVKNRAYVGVDWKITPKIKGGTWYYYESAKSNPWTHANVVVTSIKFEF